MSMMTPADRASRMAQVAREREERQRVVTQQERLAAAARTKAELPELYELAQRIRAVFGSKARISFVRFADGSTWGDDRAWEGAKVPASPSRHDAKGGGD